MSVHTALSLLATLPPALPLQGVSTPVLAGLAIAGLIAFVILLRIAVAIAIRVGLVLAVVLGVLYLLSELGVEVPVFALAP